MPTIREQCLDEVLTILRALPSAPPLVERNKNGPVENLQFPAVILVDGADDPVPDRHTGAGLAVDQAFAVALIGREPAGTVGTVLNALVGEVRVAIAAGVQLGGLAHFTRWTGTSDLIPLDEADSDPEHAMLVCGFVVERTEREDDPSQLW